MAESDNIQDISQRKGMFWALYKLRSIDRICGIMFITIKEKSLYFIFLIIIIMTIKRGFTEGLTMLANGASLFIYFLMYFMFLYLCFCKQKCHFRGCIHKELYLTTRSPPKSS